MVFIVLASGFVMFGGEDIVLLLGVYAFCH